MLAFDEAAYLEAARAGDFRKVLEPQRQLLDRLLGDHGLEQGDASEALAELTETVARVLRVARVGLWEFQEQRERLRCLDLYIAGSARPGRVASSTRPGRGTRDDRHVAGSTIHVDEAPRYFEAIQRGEVMAADDAYTDPRTCEFAAGYLPAFGVGALLDAPIYVNRRLAGVLCSEHVGGPRRWLPWERILASSLATCAGAVLQQVAGRPRRPTLRG